MRHDLHLDFSPGQIPLAALEGCLDNVLTRVSRLLAAPEPERRRVIDCAREVRMVSALIRGYRQLHQWALKFGWGRDDPADPAAPSPPPPAADEKKISGAKNRQPPPRAGPDIPPAPADKRGKRLTRRDKRNLARQISENLKKNTGTNAAAR